MIGRVAVGVTLAGAAVAGALVLSSAGQPVRSAPATRVLSGSVVGHPALGSLSGRHITLGESCDATEAVAAGADVTVTDDRGAVVGVDRLGPGVVTGRAGAPGWSARCSFAFTVTGLPVRPFYRVSVPGASLRTVVGAAAMSVRLMPAAGP